MRRRTPQQSCGVFVKNQIDEMITECEQQLIEEVLKEKEGVVETRAVRSGGGSYVRQYVKCGKPTCQCAKPSGKLHGPYWCLYTKKNGKTRCKYIGKNLPSDP